MRVFELYRDPTRTLVFYNVSFGIVNLLQQFIPISNSSRQLAWAHGAAKPEWANSADYYRLPPGCGLSPSNWLLSPRGLVRHPRDTNPPLQDLLDTKQLATACPR